MEARENGFALRLAQPTPLEVAPRLQAWEAGASSAGYSIAPGTDGAFACLVGSILSSSVGIISSNPYAGGLLVAWEFHQGEHADRQRAPQRQ
jgi:hypothetical protein